MYDGDTIFALATGKRELTGIRGMALDRVCEAGAQVFARAIVHGILAATTVGDVPAYRDAWPTVMGE